MEADEKSLEAHALEAVMEQDHELAADLLEQLTSEEAVIVRDAAIRLAGYANDVYTDGTVSL